MEIRKEFKEFTMNSGTFPTKVQAPCFVSKRSLHPCDPSHPNRAAAAAPPAPADLQPVLQLRPRPRPEDQEMSVPIGFTSVLNHLYDGFKSSFSGWTSAVGTQEPRFPIATRAPIGKWHAALRESRCTSTFNTENSKFQKNHGFLMFFCFLYLIQLENTIFFFKHLQNVHFCPKMVQEPRQLRSHLPHHLLPELPLQGFRRAGGAQGPTKLHPREVRFDARVVRFLKCYPKKYQKMTENDQMDRIAPTPLSSSDPKLRITNGAEIDCSCGSALQAHPWRELKIWKWGVGTKLRPRLHSSLMSLPVVLELFIGTHLLTWLQQLGHDHGQPQAVAFPILGPIAAG